MYPRVTQPLGHQPASVICAMFTLLVTVTTLHPTYYTIFRSICVDLGCIKLERICSVLPSFS